MLREGVITDLVFFMILAGAILYYLDRIAKDLPVPAIRVIPAMEAIEEGIGRAVEMGRGVHFCPGDVGRLSGEFGPAVVASLNLLGYTTKLCARNEVEIWTSLGAHPEIIPLAEAIQEDAYKTEGRPELYDPKKILYYGSAGYKVPRCSTILKNNVALNIQAGVFYTEIQSHAVAAKIGAINIGGSTRIGAAYGQAISCDYLFIIEDVLAAGAKASGDPTAASSIAAEDILKFILVGYGIIMMVAAMAGSRLLIDLLML